MVCKRHKRQWTKYQWMMHQIDRIGILIQQMHHARHPQPSYAAHARYKQHGEGNADKDMEQPTPEILKVDDLCPLYVADNHDGHKGEAN